MFFIEVSCTTSLHLIDQENCKTVVLWIIIFTIYKSFYILI